MKYIRNDRSNTLETIEVYEAPIYQGITVLEFVQCSGCDYQIFEDDVALSDEYGREPEEAKKYIKFAHKLADFADYGTEEEVENNHGI